MKLQRPTPGCILRGGQLVGVLLMISRTISLSLLLAALTTTTHADTFGSGANTFSIDFVTIGSPGNPADTTGDPNPAGSVPYTYRIGMYEVPEDAVRKANTLGGLGITLDSRGLNKPATSLSWFEAAKFVNWLNTSSGATPAYKFDSAGAFQLWVTGDPGYDPANLFRNTLARYFLPSADEWYKAAYFDPSTGGYWDYPTGSDTPPIAIASGTAPGTAVWNQSVGPADVDLAGGLSSFGTMAQGGNISEWEESEGGLSNDSLSFVRGVRGSGWDAATSFSMSSGARFQASATANPVNVTFRIARVIPEPKGIGLVICLSTFLVAISRRE